MSLTRSLNHPNEALPYLPLPPHFTLPYLTLPCPALSCLCFVVFQVPCCRSILDQPMLVHVMYVLFLGFDADVLPLLYPILRILLSLD